MNQPYSTFSSYWKGSQVMKFAPYLNVFYTYVLLWTMLPTDSFWFISVLQKPWVEKVFWLQMVNLTVKFLKIITIFRVKKIDNFSKVFQFVQFFHTLCIAYFNELLRITNSTFHIYNTLWSFLTLVKWNYLCCSRRNLTRSFFNC